MPDMPCAQLVELVTDYLEGALRPGEQRRFEAHLAGCEGCRDHVGQLRRTVAAVGRLEPETLSGTTRKELLATFRGWRAA